MLVFVLSGISLAVSVAQAQDATGACSSVDRFTVRKCVSARIDRKETAMNKLFARARATVARSYAHNGQFDSRTDPRILDRSQAEWKTFVMDNCTVAAAYGASSNSWISDRLTNCYERELGRRMRFVSAIASGKLDAGR
jgi:uncharacterized protein YecT (DUF1311 family)